MSHRTHHAHRRSHAARWLAATLGLTLAAGLATASGAASASAAASTGSGAGAAERASAKHASSTRATHRSAKATNRKTTKKRGNGARNAPAWPIVHRIGTIHGDAPEAPFITDETWQEYGDASSRFHARTANAQPGAQSIEFWDGPERSVVLFGDLAIAPIRRLDARSISCHAASDPAESLPLYASLDRSFRKAEREVMLTVDALQRDAAGRAALPAGPAVGGVDTVSWSTPVPESHPDYAPQHRFLFDAATGRIVREYLGAADTWRDYSTWELTIGDDSGVQIPRALTDAKNCAR